jgi:hypothetical protein
MKWHLTRVVKSLLRQLAPPLGSHDQTVPPLFKSRFFSLTSEPINSWNSEVGSLCEGGDAELATEHGKAGGNRVANKHISDALVRICESRSD